MKCPNSFCLEIRLVCDGEKHCENGEDELNCGKLKYLYQTIFFLLLYTHWHITLLANNC